MLRRKTKTYKLSSLLRLTHFKSYLIKKEGHIMNSKFVFIGLACAGVFANVFIALAGNGLDASSAKLFGNFADIAIGLAVVFLFASQKCSAEEREERDAIYRDFDAVYRYVDDTVREVKDDVRACQRGSESCCTMTKKRS